MTKTKTRVKTKVKVAVAVAGAAAIAAGVFAFTFGRPEIFIKTSPTTPEADIVIGGTEDVHVGTFVLRAKGDDFLVDSIELANCLTSLPDVDGDCADANEVNGVDAVIDEIEIRYLDINGNQVEVQQNIGGGEAIFYNMGMYLPAGQDMELGVYVHVNNVNNNTRFSGDWFRLNINTTAGTGTLLATNQNNGAVVDQSAVNQYALAKPMQLRNTEPTINLNAASPSGAAMPSWHEVLRFDVTADSNDDVVLEEFVFVLNSTDGAGSGWNLCDNDGLNNGLNQINFSVFDMNDLGTPLDVSADWTMLASDLTVCTEDTDVAQYLVLDLSTPDWVAAGSTTTYSVYMDTSGASAAHDDSVRMDVPQDKDVMNNGGADPDGALLWGDGFVNEINAWAIENLPVVGGTFVY